MSTTGNRSASERPIAPIRLWLMALPFRVIHRGAPACFNPGLRNLLKYETLRLWMAIHERERLVYLRQRQRALVARLRSE